MLRAQVVVNGIHHPTQQISKNSLKLSSSRFKCEYLDTISQNSPAIQKGIGFKSGTHYTVVMHKC